MLVTPSYVVLRRLNNEAEAHMDRMNELDGTYEGHGLEASGQALVGKLELRPWPVTMSGDVWHACLADQGSGMTAFRADLDSGI